MLYDTPFGKYWAESKEEADAWVLCEYKKIACKNIDETRNAKCSSVIDVNLSSGTFQYQADDEEAKSIALLVMSNELFGQPLPTYWRTYDNQNPAVTKADLVLISTAMKNHILAVGAKAHEIKDLDIANCNSCEGLEAICEDYKQWQPS